MAINFNTKPWFDDFDSKKNFHRILFKPGVAVQARELTQSQSILQDQITKFADNIFKQNSPVTGGQVTTNFSCYYVKLKDSINNATYDVSEFNGLLVKNALGTVRARVIATVPSTGTGGDPATLIVSYLSGQQFQDGDHIYDTASNKEVEAIDTDATGLSSVASISDGVFYVLGNFVQVSNSTTVLSKYTNSPSLRIGLTITETVVDYIDDNSLLDPAIGASNYQAPGADRYLISLTLDTRPLQFGDDDNFIELVRVENGSVYKMVDGSVYATIDDYFAKRDYETNGDYVVNDFKLTPKTDPESNSTYILNVGKGLAYVHGYRVENPSPVDLTSNRAREFQSQNNSPVYINYGNYLYVDTIKGNTNFFFDVTGYQNVDFHCVTTSQIDTSTSTKYNSTLMGTGKLRNIEFDFNTGSNANVSSYVYRAFMYDVDTTTKSSNSFGTATSTTIRFPVGFSETSNAYDGVNITITNGTNAGDFRTIVGYDGATRTATVNQSWTVVPDITSQFTLDFDVKDFESFVAVDGSYNIKASANMNSAGKTGGVATGETILENPKVPELLFNIGSPYIKYLNDTSYSTSQVFRGVTFNTGEGGTVEGQLNYEGDYLDIIRHFGTPGTTLSDDTVKENFVIVVTNPGIDNPFSVGDVLSWTNPDRTVTLDADASIATLSATGLNPFTATIIAKVFVENADNLSKIVRVKNLVRANTTAIFPDNLGSSVVGNSNVYVDDNSIASLTPSTGQVYILNAGLVAPGSKQSLYLVDVKNVAKIIDTRDPNDPPTIEMATNALYDVTGNYTFDNGQRDGYYDHASISLKPGAPQPVGNLLVYVNYYQHSGGDGYFSKLSYDDVSTNKEDYASIPSYTSKNGTKYYLRDCLDFRPARKNSTTAFEYRYGNEGSPKYGALTPTDGTTFVGDYQYYLGRIDKLILTKDKSLQIIEGKSSVNPSEPPEPDGSLVIAVLSHKPYTSYLPSEAPPSYLPDLSINRVQHKRYTMQDIAGLESRINRIDYYTSLSLLEKDAQSLQISDAYGLNRFKNGILVDDFSGFGTADTYNYDFLAKINRRTREMTCSQEVDNFPLKDINLTKNMGRLSSSVANTLSYKINSDGQVNFFTLPYTTANLTSQKIASRTVNLNPFAFSLSEGVVVLSPNMDTWVNNKQAPALLITDPNLKVFRGSDNINVLQVGDWKTISSTTVVDSVSSGSSTNTVNQENHDWTVDKGFGLGVGTSTTTTTNWTSTTFRTTTQQQQTNVAGYYNNIGNTYGINNGYITDISILPWLRAQQVVIRAAQMLYNTPVHCYFDNVNVDNYVRKSNVIELTNVLGTFQMDDTIGYMNNNVFVPTGRIVGVHNYISANTVSVSSNVRLYVGADQSSNTYTPNLILVNATFKADGSFDRYTASGKVASSSHYGGRVMGTLSQNQIRLSPLASSSDNYYNGNTVYICSGTGIGKQSQISSYSGTTKIANLSTPISTANGDIYSIGSLSTDENGQFNAIFNLPENVFHSGERVFRVDNRTTLNNAATATTWAESTFYGQGIATSSQALDFGASPAGAKNTFLQTNNRTLVSFNTQTSSSTSQNVVSWDPVAQTFLIDGSNYPNGAFLKRVKLFFRTKPTLDNSPITLYVVGTLNGYPNGTTIDHGIATITRDKVKVSENPQYLDASTYTTFEFDVPVYIRPDVLYAFIIKTQSTEYNLWTASNGDQALVSSVKNLPTDANPPADKVSKITTAPYVGGLFISQNAQTWTVDQNQSLMFVIDRCVFDTTKHPEIRFTVPQRLPQRVLYDDGVDYYLDANNVTTNIATSNTSMNVDAFNISTTDFVPTLTGINYTYESSLATDNSLTIKKPVNPGKYGSSMYNDILLNDGKGERVLNPNTSTSFSVYATLNSYNDAVSPVISDAGLSVYSIKNHINNCELSNTLVTVVNSGNNYSTSANVTVTVSSPTGKNGRQAYAKANVVDGKIISVGFTDVGAGYITTPTVTISDANTTPGTGAIVTITGETSAFSGPAVSRYVTKKVVLDAGFDSGDLNVYASAYRPVGTDILVYYKILNRADTQKFEDSNWQLMTKIQNTDSLYSKTANELHEYVFAPGTDGKDQGYVEYTNSNGQYFSSFSQFALKIVLVTNDKTNIPHLTDMRSIALPKNVNTTF